MKKELFILLVGILTIGVVSGADSETQSNFTIDKDEDLNDVTKGAEFCLAFGAEAVYELDLGSIFLDLRYSPGLSNILDSDNSEIKLGSFMIIAGWKFPISL